MNVAMSRPGLPARGAAPLLMLLALDVANGCWALATGQPATLPALVIKAALALWLALEAAWSAAVLVAMVLPLICIAGWFALRPDALQASQLDAVLLLAKTAGTGLLMALVASHVRSLPDARRANYLRLVLLVIGASLSLGLAGIGHDRYGDDEAFLTANGFMPAGNELNVALVALFWWLSDRRALGVAVRADQALYWACAALMLVCGSKTTIASAALVALWFHRRHPLRLVLVLAAALVGFRVLVATAVWDRWLFFFGVHFDDGVLSALTSGRFGRAADAVAGWRTLPFEGSPFMAINGYVESDPLDLVLNFGGFGVLMMLVFTFVLWRATGGRLVPWLLVMAASTLAGHVVYSVFAAPVLAAALAPTRRPVGIAVSGGGVVVAEQPPGGDGRQGGGQFGGEAVVQRVGPAGVGTH